MHILKDRRSWLVLGACLLATALAFGAFLLNRSASSAVAEGPAAPASLFHLEALAASPSQEKVPFLQQGSLAESGYEVADGRLLATDDEGSQVVVVPRRAAGASGFEDQLCIVVTQPSAPTRGAGACNSADAFNADGIFVTLSTGDPAADEVVGVLPDDVVSVTLRTGPQQGRRISVTQNVVRFPHNGVTSVGLAGPDGEVDRPIASGLNE